MQLRGSSVDWHREKPMLNCEWIDFDAYLTEQLIKMIYANSLYDPQFLSDLLA